jgi:hypothetical protein
MDADGDRNGHLQALQFSLAFSCCDFGHQTGSFYRVYQFSIDRRYRTSTLC